MFDKLCRSRSACTDNTSFDTSSKRENAHGSEQQLDLSRVGVGHGSILTFADADTLVSVVDLRLDRALRADNEAMEDLLLVRANISSACNYSSTDGMVWRFARPALTVSVIPKGSRFGVVVEAGTALTAVTILLRPAALLERFGLDRDDLPLPLLGALDTAATTPQTLVTLPLEADVASLVEDLVHSRLPSQLRGLQVAARVAELIVLTCAAWKERLTAGSFPSLRSREAELVAAARRILMDRMTDPPTLQALAHELGTNRNKLNQVFQRGMGVTIKTFCVQRRIERAQALLYEGRLNVAQIAETVGYQHQSSFAAAFREVVGMSPRDYGGFKRATEPELALH